MYERILVPLDGSRLSTKALPHAVEIARRFSAEIIPIRVASPTSIASISSLSMGGMEATVDPATVDMTSQEAARQNRNKLAQASRYLSRHLRGLRGQGVQASKRTTLGRVTQSILDVCKKDNVDLVVMTTRGRSGLKRAVLGSTADDLVRQRGVPVLVVRP